MQRTQQAALQAELKSTQTALAEATARQSSRDAALDTLLARMKKSKAAVQKPEQVIAALPSVLPLPGRSPWPGTTIPAKQSGKASAHQPAANPKPAVEMPSRARPRQPH